MTRNHDPHHIDALDFQRHVLEAFCVAHGIERARTQTIAQGFRYWPSEIAIDVRMRPPAGPTNLWTLSASLPVARPVPIEAPDTPILIDTLNLSYDRFATVLDGDTLTFRAHVRVDHDTIDEATAELAHRASYFLEVAAHEIDALLDVVPFGGPRASRVRPPVPNPDMIQDPKPAHERSEDDERARKYDLLPPEREPDFRRAIATLERMNIGTVQAIVDEDAGSECIGLRAVIETNNMAFLLELERTRLREAGSERHEDDGMHVSLRVTLEDDHSQEELSGMARDLNDAEYHSDLTMHGSGGWTMLAPNADLTYITFHPNRLLTSTTATHAVTENVDRIHWLLERYEHDRTFTLNGTMRWLIFGGDASP